jgi:hypothetical protein
MPLHWPNFYPWPYSFWSRCLCQNAPDYHHSVQLLVRYRLG